ncbi:hypothetical protein Vafri_19725 [Volvox africanus]|uniref:Uncharacterized protein n=1 Tax=Volvox africanus TaxID=51714 RepID=A0A8J4F9Z5_9CHLO|nr:hypothetical protein Vafri_19725 [Volvox africanus]
MMAMVGNLAQVCQDAEALLTIDVSDDLTPIGLQTSEKPVVPSGADDLVAYYEKQLAAAQLVQQRLEKQCHQLAEEKLALETSLSVQTSAMQQQLVLAREKAERVFAQAEHAQQQVHDARAAVSEVVDAVTHLAELLDVSGATKELTQSFEAVARSTQRTFQAVTAAQEGAQVVLDLQLGARDACQVSPLFAALSAGGHHEVDAMRKLEEDAIRLRKELDSARRREQELEAEMRAAQVLFSGLEAEVVSLQHDQAQAAAKLQLSQEELLAARDEIIVAQQALLVAQSPAAGVLTQGLAKLDGHLVSVRNFLEELSMPKPPVIDELGCSNLQDSASIGSFETEAEADIEKLKDLISGLQEQLKVKDGELRGARYASLVIHQRAEARSGKPLGDPGDESPISPGDQCARGAQAGSPVTTPTFSYLLAARSQAIRSPAAAMGGLSTVQVALIAAEREVLSLRSQLSHRQQHIKLLEQRLLEQSQDIAAMCNRGDALASSPVASRKASFVERRLGLGTEALLPQKAWDFDGVDLNSASGNLAEQMRPQDVRMSGDDNGTSRLIQVPLGEEDESSDGARSETETRKPSSGFQVHVSGDRQQESRESIISLSDLLVERDRTVQQLRAQINEYRAVLAAAAGSRHEQDHACLGHRQQVNPAAVLAQSIAEFNPRITLEDLPEGYPEWSHGSQGGYAGDTQAAGSSSIPPPFRLSSGGPLPFQLAGDMDGVRNAASGLTVSGADDGPAASTSCPTSIGTGELSRSSSSRVLDVLKRQLDEAAQMLESSQDQLARTTSELTALQGLMDALSKADPSAAHSSMPRAGSVEPPDDAQLPLVHQVSFQEVRARIPTGSGLGPSTTKLNELRAQLLDVMKAIQSGQDHLLAMQAEAGAKEASIARLSEQLQALRVIADAPLVEGVGAVLTSEPTLSQQVVVASGTDSCAVQIATATPLRPLSPSVEVNVVTPLSPPISSPSQRPAINSDADTYTPSLVMNPMFHRDAIGSSDIGSDAARMAAFLSNASAATGEGYFGATLGHAQADPSTTVHRNLLFDEDGLRRTKESGSWQYEQHDSRLSVGTFPESIESDAPMITGHNVLFASAEVQPPVQLKERRHTNTKLPNQLPDASQPADGSTHGHPVYLHAHRQGMPPASPLRSQYNHGPLLGVMDRSQGGPWPSDDRTDDPQASKFPGTVSVVRDVESELSQDANARLDTGIHELSAMARELELCTQHLREAKHQVSAAEAFLAEERSTRQRLEQQLAEAEGIILAFQVCQKQVQPLADGHEWGSGEPNRHEDETRDQEALRARVGALESELQVATQRLNASTRELTATAVDLEASTQRLAEASVVAAAVEADLEAERRTRQQLEQQIAEAVVGRTATGILGQQALVASVEMGSQASAPITAEFDPPPFPSFALQPSKVITQLVTVRSPITSRIGDAAGDDQVQRQNLMHSTERSPHAEPRHKELLEALADARERAETLSQAYAQTQVELDAALVARDAALTCVEELRTANEKAQAEVERLSSRKEAQWQAMELWAKPDGVNDVAGAKLGSEELDGQLHQGEEQVHTLQAQVEDQSTSLHAVGLARAGEHLESLEAALAAAQSVNNSLWLQLGSIASAIGMDVSTVQQASSSRGTARTAQDGEVAASVSDVGLMAGQTSGCPSRVSESQLTYGHLTSTVPGNGDDEHGHSLGRESTTVASLSLPTSQHRLHEDYDNLQLSQMWSGPLNFKTALLCGAARSAAAALQSVGDVPVSPSSKSVVLHSSMLSQASSPDMATVRLGHSMDSPAGDLTLMTAGMRSSSESHGDVAAQQPPMMCRQGGQKLHAVLQGSLGQRGLQLLQPEYATSVSSIASDTAGSQAIRDGEANFTVVPDVAAAVQVYLDTVHADASAVRAQFEANMQLTRSQIAAALKQVAELREKNEDLRRERENWRSSFQWQSANQQEEEAHDHNVPDIQFVMTADLSTGNVMEGQVHDHVNMAHVNGLGAGKAAQCEDMDAGCLDRVKHLAEAHADILGRQERLSVETTASMQRQTAEVMASRAGSQQQLDAAEVNDDTLQAKLDATGHIHMGNADPGQAMVENQLAEARVKIEALLERVSTAEEVAASAQRQVVQVEALRMQVLQQLNASEAARDALQTELDNGVGIHAATAAELEAAKESLQQYKDVELQCATTNKELAEAHIIVEGLKDRLSAAEKSAASLQQQVAGLELLRVELLQQLEVANMARGALQAELSRGVSSHAAAVAELGVAQVLLQQQYDHLDSCHAMAEKQLAEACAMTKVLQEDLSTNKEVAASAQQQVSELEASRAILLQQLEAAEVVHKDLQAELDRAVGIHAAAVLKLEAENMRLQQQYDNADSGRAMAEKQLAEARAMIEALLERLSTAEDVATSTQQQVVQVEASRAQVLQQLDAAEVAHDTLRAELDRAVGDHAATVSDLETAKASLRQQCEISESRRTTAEKQLAEARVIIEGLEERLSSTGKAVVSLQQQIVELESSRAELLQQLEVARTAHSALHVELNKAVASHSAALVELEASRVSLEHYNRAESGRVTAEQQLSEAHAVIKDLEERLSAVEETVATLQQQVGEVEASRVDLRQQLDAVEIARVTLQVELDRVTENHAAAVLEYEGTKMLLQQQCKSVDVERAVAEQQVADARATAEKQLTEARATIEALLEQKSMAQETVASMQQQVIEVEASHAKLQQQLDTVLLSYGALQADMGMSACAHATVVAELEAAKKLLQQRYEAAEFTRSKAEQQLDEACTSIEDLQKDLSATLGTVASLQQRVVELEASRAELQQQLVKAEASRDALQANFDVAARAHAIAVADLEATNVSLQQKFDDVKAGHGMAEQQLEEARATIKTLLEQISVTQETGASMQQRVMEFEASHTELQRQLDVAEVNRDAYAKMVIELEAAKESLQQRYKDADAGRAIAIQQLEEACAKMQALEQSMSMAEKMCSSMQQQIDVLETSRTESLQQLRAAEESQKALRAELEEADRVYSGTVAELEAAKLALQQECVDANAGRVKAEQQLADAQAMVKDLQQRVSAAGQAMTFMQQPIGQVEALCTQLQRQVAAAEANRSILQADLRDATGTFSDAVVESDAAKGCRASLTYRLEAASQEAAAHAVHAEKLAESLAETQAFVAKLECLLAESNAELCASTEREQELEQQLGGKEQRLLEQELDRRVVAQELEALQQRVAELQVDVEGARDNAESVSAHLDEYKVISRQQCMEAEQARADAIMDAAAVREELVSLRTALLLATSETEAHRIRLAAVEVELSKVESQMESLQCGICSSEAQADELRGELAAVQYDLMSTRDERDDAMRQLNENREASLKLAEYQQQLDRLRQELDNAGVQQATLSQKLAETHAELSAARDERQAVVMQANGDVAVVKQHLAESQAMLATSQGELQETVKELADTRKQLMAAFTERDSVKAQLSEVHATKQAELLSAMKELGEAQKQLQIAWLERDNAAAKLAEAVTEKQMELLNALKELAEARKQLHVALSDRDTAAAQLAEALTERQTELLGVTAELVEARKQLLAALSDRDTMAAKLAEAQIERQTELLGITTELSEARKQLQAALSECNMTAAKMVEVQADKQAELQSLTAGLAEAGKLHQAALSERDAAAAKLVDAEMRLASAQEAVGAKCAEHEAAVKLLESALAAKDTACSDLSSIRSELLTTVRMLSEVRDERDSVMSELEDMQIEVRSLQDRVSILLKQLTDAQGQAQKASEQRDVANGRIVELEGQLVVTGELLASAHGAIESRRAEHEADIKLLDLALADKASLRIDLEGMQSQVLAALNELSDARAQRDAAMQQLNAVRDVLAVIEEERSSATAAAVATAAVMREQQRTVEVQQRNLDASRASEASRVAEHLRALELRADELKQYAEDLQHRLVAAEAHLSSERTEAKVVHSRLELQLTSARAELESIAADRTSALQQLAATRTELLQVTASCADLQEKVHSLEQLSELLQGQLDINKQKLLDAENRVAAERLSTETAQTKAEELQGKLCADLAAAHAELMAVAAQRNALEAQLTVVLPTLSVAQAEHAAGLRQISHMKGDHAILESHLVPLEEYGKVLEQQAEDLRQQLSRAEAQHAAERADTQSAILQLEAQLDAVRTELVAATSARDVSAQQVGNLRSENLEFVAAHAKLEVQLRLLQEHVDHLQQQAGSLQEQLTGAEARLLGERAEAHSARTQAAAVRAELAAVMAERDMLASQAAALTTELASVRVSYESVVQQQELTVQAKANLEEQVRSHEQHTAQLQSQLGDIVRLREHLQETEAKFVAERECRIATERLLATAKAEVSEVHGELAMLRKELAAVTKKLTSQQALTESRVGEMQVKIAQARAQASEESDKVYRLQQELAEMKAALKGAKQHLLDQDVDAKGMVTGLQEALETTRATLEAERARGEQKAKELQELLHIAITREASAHEKLNQLRDELDAACAAQQASQAAAEMDITSLKEELLDAQRALHTAKQAALGQEAELKASIQAANKMAASSQQRVACLDAQVMEVRTAESEARRALAEARHSMDQKEAGAARQIASLKASLAEAQEAIAGLETHQKRAEDASRITEGEMVVMGDKLREERERTSLLEPRIEALAEEVAVLQAELSNARTALNRYEAYALDAEAEIQELRSAAEVSSEENVRLQQQLDQLVEQLRRQTQQLRAAETDAAQLRQEVAAMNLMGARRSRSTSRGQSAERRHGSAGRAVAGGRASRGATSILEDSANAQQLLILRKTQQTSRHPSPAVMTVGSGSNSTASRTGEGKAAFGQRARPRAGSMEPRPPLVGATLEQPVDISANNGPGTRSLSPASLLQKRLTDEATQLRWEVVADSSRIRELQEKRAGGVYLNRAEVAEMELLTARLGAHHARISAIMDTVKLARGQQPQGVLEQANMTPTPGGFESCRSPARANVPSDLEFPDQPRQQPVLHPHPPAHPPVRYSFGEVGSSGTDAMAGLDAHAVVQRSPQAASHVGSSRGLSHGSEPLETPSRMRFFDLETRAKPAELPRTTVGTNELHLGQREALGRRDEIRSMGTPKDLHRFGDTTPNQDVDLMRGGVEYRSGNSKEQVQHANDSISPHAMEFVYGTFPSPSSQNARSTLAIINVSPWYPPGATPGRVISPVRAASPASMAGSTLTGAAERGGHYGGRTGGVTPVRERDGEGKSKPHITDTDEVLGGVSPLLPTVGGEALGGGPGAGAGPRAATRYRTPYLKMLQDMVLLGQIGGGKRGGIVVGATRDAGPASETHMPSHGSMNAVVLPHYGRGDASFEAIGHWGSSGGADGNQGPVAPYGSPGGRGQSPCKEHPNRPVYMPSDIGPGRACD